MPQTCPIGADHRRSNRPPSRAVAREIRRQRQHGRSREWLASHFSLTPSVITAALTVKPPKKKKRLRATSPPTTPTRVEVAAVGR